MKAFIYIGVICAMGALSIWFPKLMLNPGPLSAGHKTIEKKCTSCHTFFQGIDQAGCRSCHPPGEIDRDSAGAMKALQFHARLQGQSCTSCHTDHRGADPALATLAFDHDLLAATVVSNCGMCHQAPPDSLHMLVSVSCGSCHDTRNWRISGGFDHDLISGRARNNCAACHPKPADALHASLTDHCADCHATSKWSPATFDHAAYFILDADHNTRCTTCHTSGGNFKIYSCYGCHEHAEAEIAREHREEGIFVFDDCASCHRGADEHDIRSRGSERDRDLEKIRKHVESGKNREGGKDGDDDD